jgi:ParB family transcriptional regulator, chromosome partitioning protein
MQIEQVKLNQLSPASEAPDNLKLAVRKADDDEETFQRLLASIRAVGLLAPLLVKQDGERMYVAGGNRRLRALREIHNDNGAEVEVPVIDVTQFPGDAREIALMHNISLPPHPIDQYEVMSGLVSDGMSIEDIGARYGFNARQVDQIMAYGSLAQEIRDAWRTGEIDAAAAASFTLADDDLQLKILAKLRKGDYNINSRNVRMEILGNINDIGKCLEFVGIDTYEAAGGIVRRDLFGIDHQASDQKLVRKMVGAKLEHACTSLCAQGWQWAIVLPGDSYRYQTREPARLIRTPEQRARLQELKAELGPDLHYDDEFKSIEAAIKLASYSSDERAALGCFVSVAQDGTLRVDPGRVMPDKAKEGAEDKSSSPRESPTPAEKKKTERERQRRAEAGEVSNKLGKDLAFALRTATEIALKDSASYKDPPLITTIYGILADLIKHHPRTLSDGHMAAIRAGMDGDIMNNACGKAFDSKSYFEAIPKANILAVIKESINEDEARKASEMSKGDLEKFAHQNVPLWWLPVQLRTPHYRGVGDVKAARKRRG